MKHWKSLRKIDLTKKLPFSLTFLEVHLLLGKKQGKNLPSLSKFITETTKSQNWNIWKDQWCLAGVAYIYAWHINIPVNGPILLEKALESAKALNYGDLLISKLTRIINHGRRDKMRQSSISNFFKQQWFELHKFNCIFFSFFQKNKFFGNKFFQLRKLIQTKNLDFAICENKSVSKLMSRKLVFVKTYFVKTKEIVSDI